MKYLVVLIATVVCAAFGAYLSLAGALSAGLPQTSSWSLEPLIYMGLGIMTGAISLVVFFGILKKMDFGVRLGFSIILSVVVAFLSGVVGYPISVWDSKRNAVKTSENRQADRRLYDEYYAAIRADPGIVVRKQWYVRWAPQWSAYFDSLSDSTIRYMPEMLSEIYRGKIYKEHTSRVLEHPAFDPKLLEREFYRYFKQSLRSNDHGFLAAVLSNPQARDSWFEMVIESPLFKDDQSAALQKNLNKWLEKRGDGNQAPNENYHPENPLEENQILLSPQSK